MSREMKWKFCEIFTVKTILMPFEMLIEKILLKCNKVQ